MALFKRKTRIRRGRGRYRGYSVSRRRRTGRRSSRRKNYKRGY